MVVLGGLLVVDKNDLFIFVKTVFMKNSKKIVFIITTLIICISFVAFTNLPDSFTFKFSESEINTHYQNLSTIKTIVERSNLPHQEVIFVEKSIDSLQGELVRQIKLQVPPAKK